jgi:adenosylmethionine-8-amino-7-oxononanoate aminotransferase
MAEVANDQVVVVRADGCWIWDDTGRGYLDASAALWYCNVGHGRREIADAAWAQMKRVAAYHTFDVFANEPALDLAERLVELLPFGAESAVFFTNGGSDAVDSACKFARRYWRIQGRSERTTIIARSSAYHGMNGFGTSLAGIEANAAGWGALMPDVQFVPWDDLQALEDVLERDGDHVAAVIGEMVIGAGGVLPPPPGYWEGVRALCDTYDVLLIADEVVTGFGRLGHWFGSERYGIEPDLIVGAKGVTSGYAPLGFVAAGPKVRSAFWSLEAGALRHGYTYSGHPTACAVALENLAILERESIPQRVHDLEPTFAETLGALADHPLVEEVRCAGFLAGVGIAPDARAARPRLVDEIVRAARHEGLIVRNLVGHTLQISPPLTISTDEIRYIADRLLRALDSVVLDSQTAALSENGP